MLKSKKELMETNNIMEFLSQIPCGHMIFGSTAIDGEDFKTTVFIKMEEKFIKRLGYAPVFQTRAGLINVGGVPVLNMQIRINMSERMHLEGFLNYMTEYELPAFKDFSTMDKINYVFVNERTEIVTIVKVKNEVKEEFIAAIKIASEFTPWGMTDFDIAKAKLMNRYSVQELWDKFRNK